MINMYLKLAMETCVLISDKPIYLSTNGLLMELHTNWREVFLG